MPRPDSSGVVSVNGSRLYFAIFHRGGGAPVLLLHGGSASSEIWAGEVERLRGSHEVIVIDTRGHGRSSRSAEPFSYAGFASDALGMMDSLRLSRVAVVGWSDGGVTGLVLAIEHPDRVTRLFTYGANFDRTGYSSAPPDSVARANGRRFRERMAAEYARLSPTPDGFPALSAALDTLYAREPAITTAALQSIRVPTGICAGEHEQFITRAHTEALAHWIPGARLIILPGISHGGPLQDPDGFHRAVETFLDARQ